MRRLRPSAFRGNRLPPISGVPASPAAGSLTTRAPRGPGPAAGSRGPDSPRSLQMPAGEPAPVLRPAPAGCRCARPDRRAAAPPWCRRCRTGPGPAAGGFHFAVPPGQEQQGNGDLPGPLTPGAGPRIPRRRIRRPPRRGPVTPAGRAGPGHRQADADSRPEPMILEPGVRIRPLPSTPGTSTGAAHRAQHQAREPGAAHRARPGSVDRERTRHEHRARGPGQHRERPGAWTGSAPDDAVSGLVARRFRRRGSPGRPGR
ncbi:hypothetical protein YW7DRAFT_07099 [Streptomyces sp. AmelKG-E11A]|nr:hypothetical protein YW7DRAFT_05191 [Streptomyces sp. AmelKG-E11A]SCK63321.1 hypothetical protein YW7DRAFT_07099 [Streptomyces sp. AmelKG-E11A]